eukprot:2985872-Rhodomonas_salina.2
MAGLGGGMSRQPEYYYYHESGGAGSTRSAKKQPKARPGEGPQPEALSLAATIEPGVTHDKGCQRHGFVTRRSQRGIPVTRYPGYPGTTGRGFANANSDSFAIRDPGPSVVQISNPAVPSTLYLPPMVENVYQEGM